MSAIKNELGTISISSEVIAIIAGHSIEECYGIVGMASKRATDGISELLHLENYSKGIIVKKNEEDVDISVFVQVIYGVSINAVAEIAKETVRRVVQDITGLKVGKVNVTVESVKV